LNICFLIGITLSNNKIEEIGIKHLLRALETNKTLHTLVLTGNPGYNEKNGPVLFAKTPLTSAQQQLKATLQQNNDKSFRSEDTVTISTTKREKKSSNSAKESSAMNGDGSQILRYYVRFFFLIFICIFLYSY
jgi:hypothetical protein